MRKPSFVKSIRKQVHTHLNEYISIDNLYDVSYTQKEIIYDDIEQTYELIKTKTDDVVLKTDDYDELVAKIRPTISKHQYTQINP